MNKQTFVISSPFDCYSGYSSHSRDVIKAIINLDKWDVKLVSMRWGSTPFGFVDDHTEEWGYLKDHIIPLPLTEQPDIWMQITVPNEFQKVGKYSIGMTAGIETTLCAPEWLQGINRMDLTLVSSKHAKNTFMNTKYDMKDEKTGAKQGVLKVDKPVEILFEGVDLTTYYPLTWET